MSSKEIGKLKSTLRTRFCKSIITDAKENYYITDNDLAQFIEYFKIGVVMIKDYKNQGNNSKKVNTSYLIVTSMYLRTSICLNTVSIS